MSSFSEIPSASAFTGAVVLVFNLQLSLSCYLSSRDEHSKKCETNTNHCWAAMDVPCLHVLQSQRIPPQLTRKVIKSSSQAHISGWNVLYPTPLETLACSYIWQMSSIARLLSWFEWPKMYPFEKNWVFCRICFSVSREMGFVPYIVPWDSFSNQTKALFKKTSASNWGSNIWLTFKGI